MIAWVIFSMATSPIPGVSRESSTVMRSMAPSLADTSTVNSPCLPIPVPIAVTSPSAFLSLPAAASLFLAAASSWLMGAQPARASVPPSAARALPVRNCRREQPDIITSLGRTSSERAGTSPASWGFHRFGTKNVSTLTVFHRFRSLRWLHHRPITRACGEVPPSSTDPLPPCIQALPLLHRPVTCP